MIASPSQLSCRRRLRGPLCLRPALMTSYSGRLSGDGRVRGGGAERLRGEGGDRVSAGVTMVLSPEWEVLQTDGGAGGPDELPPTSTPTSSFFFRRRNAGRVGIERNIKK